LTYKDVDRTNVNEIFNYIKQQNLRVHKLELKLKHHKRRFYNQRVRLEETIRKKMEKPEIIITEASLLMGAKIVSIGDSVLDKFKAYEQEREQLADKINTLVSQRLRS
jgi:hypothetical protein